MPCSNSCKPRRFMDTSLPDCAHCHYLPCCKTGNHSRPLRHEEPQPPPACWLQGIRGALPQDLRSIEALLKPLEEKGILAPRSRPQLIQDLPHFRVAERDGKVGEARGKGFPCSPPCLLMNCVLLVICRVALLCLGEVRGPESQTARASTPDQHDLCHEDGHPHWLLVDFCRCWDAPW